MKYGDISDDVSDDQRLYRPSGDDIMECALTSDVRRT